MRLRRIVARGFTSYRDLDLDLSELDLVAIVGDNGAGKSSLIEMVTFALWGETTRDDPINEDVEEAEVSVEFDARGKRYVVTRSVNRTGRDSSLTLVSPGDVVEDATNQRKHTKAETQAHIDRVIGLGYDAISAGPLMLQDKGSPLMDLAPRERKELLIRLFGVEIYEAYHAAASAKALEYGREADAFDRDIRDLEDQLGLRPEAERALADRRFELLTATQERERTQTAYLEAKEKQVALREKARHVETLRQTVETLRVRIEGDQREYNRQLRAISDAHQVAETPEPVFEPLDAISDDLVQQLDDRMATLMVDQSKRSGIEGRIPVLQQTLERNEKLAAIVTTVPCNGEGIYASCRFLTGAPTKDDLAQQRLEIEQLGRQAAGLASADDVAAARAAYERARRDQTAVTQELLRRETTVAQWRLKVENARHLTEQGQDGLRRLEAQVQRDQGVLARALEQLQSVSEGQEDTATIDMQVESLKAQVEEQSRTIDIVYGPAVTQAEEALRRLDEARDRHALVSRQSKEARGKADVYGVIAKAFHRDGIPTLIIENGLPIIEERANEILARMPGQYRVRILTQRENKKGGLMDRVSISVERNGRARPYRNLSGGQKFRVNFALRVAIGRVLAHRAGASIETLILDEGWGSQDEHGVEALLESLASVQDEFSLIVVITHQEPVIKRFDTRLVVSLPDEGYSQVELVG